MDAVKEFFALVLKIWETMPPAIQALISLILATTVFFGIIQMMRT